MAHVWRKEERDWVSTALDRASAGVALVPSDLGADPGEGAIIHPTLLCSTEASLGEVWLLAAPPNAAVAINGEPLRSGLIALRDRDEIRLAGGERIFFSTQELATAQPFAGGSSGLRCPRCRRPFDAGSPIVRCPGTGCGVIHHQADDLPCWTYAERCAVCPQSTALDAADRWSPESL